MSAGLTMKRQHICPLEEYVRRLTGEIVVKISQFNSTGLSGLGETGLRQLGLTTNNRNTSYPTEGRVCFLRCEIGKSHGLSQQG
jgi:hypothetical protein